MTGQVETTEQQLPQERPVFLGVLFISMAVLLLQIALTRIFSFTLWYHFAYVTISIALLGYGASGSVLAAFPGIAGSSPIRRLPMLALACSVSVIVSLILCAIIPFHPFRIHHDPALQVPSMLAYYAAVALPFFLAGLCISTALKTFSHRVGRFYFFDLFGAGLGCLIVVFAINVLSTPGAVILAAVLMSVGGLFFAVADRKASVGLLAASLIVLGGAGAVVVKQLDFNPAPEKFLAMVKIQPNARFLSHNWSAIFRTDVFAFPDEEATRTGSYAGWGISPKWKPFAAERAPKLRCMTHDGDAGAIIYNFDGTDLSTLEMVDHHVLTAPYLLVENPDVFVIGVGGGTDIVNAIKNGARHVTGVELDAYTVDTVKHAQADFAGHIYDRPDVTMIVGEGRSTLRHSNKLYDVIQLSGVDTLAALGTGGAYILSESYLYTVEAITEFLNHLTPNGVLSIMVADFSGPDTGFPRQTIRQLSLFIEALARRGVEDPENHIIVMASAEGVPQVEMLLRKRPFTPEEVGKVTRFAEEMEFRIWNAPGEPRAFMHSEYLRARGEAQAQMLAEVPLNLHATTDDNPFFFNFYQWRHLHENMEVDVGHTLATGQIVMAMILGMSILASIVLILGPLILFQRKGLRTEGKGGFILFFTGIGLGFIFIEISFIQKFVLFLGYPTYSLTVVLASLLVSSGIGSFLTSRMDTPPARRLPWVMAGLTIVSLLYLVGIPPLFQAFLGEALAFRIAIAAALLVPLGLLMGMFFPSGIQIVRASNPEFVPWAWAVNGCSSVVGTILSIILAMSFGFRIVTFAAITVYLIGILGIRASARRIRAI